MRDSDLQHFSVLLQPKDEQSHRVSPSAGDIPYATLSSTVVRTFGALTVTSRLSVDHP